MAAPKLVRSASKKQDYFAHPLAIIEGSAEIGARTKIWAYSHLMSGCFVGSDCILGERVHVGPGVTVGNHCKIQNGVNLYTGVTLEDWVFFGPNAQTTNERHIGLTTPAGVPQESWVLGYTIVRRGAAIGANAVLVAGTKRSPLEIGKYAIIGAGTVVTKNVPDLAIVVGNPGRVIGYRKADETD